MCNNPSTPSFLYISSTFDDKFAVISDALLYDLALKISALVSFYRNFIVHFQEKSNLTKDRDLDTFHGHML